MNHATMLPRVRLALAALAFTMALAAPASAQAPADTITIDNDPILSDPDGVPGVLGGKQQILLGCVQANYLTAQLAARSSNLLVCHGGTADQASWAQVGKQAVELKASATRYFTSLGDTAVPSQCGVSAVPVPPTISTAAETLRVTTLQAARDVLTGAIAKLAAAKKDLATVVAKLPKATPAVLEAANKAVVDAGLDVDKATVALDPLEKADADARAAAEKARQTKISAASDEAKQARQDLDTALVKAMGVSTADFQSVVEDKTRLSACLTLRDEVLAMYSDARRAAVVKSNEAEERATRESARATDVLRKSSALTSAVTGATPLLDTAGSPDHVVFSAMSALGADSKVVGTQVVSQLNLASLVEPDNAKRLKLPVFTRNVFLRAALPLSSTENKPQAGAADSAATAATATRFSMLFGGSLYDEADPRLQSADACYGAVYGYQPAAFRVENIDAVTAARKGFLDQCTRAVARSNRLAWRAGAGFVTVADKTKLEVLAAALVYAPTSAIYFNAIYQNLQAPSVRHAFGGGWSLGMNVGGPDSGVNAWGRIGIDFTMLGIYQPDKPAGTQFDWETRIAPSLRARVFGSQFFTLGVGPRKIGSSDHFDVLATFALTADADTLVNGLLSPPTPAADPAPAATP